MKELSVDIGKEFGSPLGQTKTVGDLVSVFLSASFAIAGLIILFLFILAGYSFITGAGSGDSKKIQEGKNAITSAIIGFVIIISAYWIIRIIETITGSNFLTNPNI